MRLEGRLSVLVSGCRFTESVVVVQILTHQFSVNKPEPTGVFEHINIAGEDKIDIVVVVGEDFSEEMQETAGILMTLLFGELLHQRFQRQRMEGIILLNPPLHVLIIRELNLSIVPVNIRVLFRQRSNSISISGVINESVEKEPNLLVAATGEVMTEWIGASKDRLHVRFLEQ